MAPKKASDIEPIASKKKNSKKTADVPEQIAMAEQVEEVALGLHGLHIAGGDAMPQQEPGMQPVHPEQGREVAPPRAKAAAKAAAPVAAERPPAGEQPDQQEQVAAAAQLMEIENAMHGLNVGREVAAVVDIPHHRILSNKQTQAGKPRKPRDGNKPDAECVEDIDFMKPLRLTSMQLLLGLMNPHADQSGQREDLAPRIQWEFEQLEMGIKVFREWQPDDDYSDDDDKGSDSKDARSSGD